MRRKRHIVSIWTITPAPTVMTLLKRHRTKQNEMRLKAGEAWKDEGFVFCNEYGEHLSPNTVYHNYKRIVAKLGIPERRLHDLRHSYAVASLVSGDDIKTVQENMGHFGLPLLWIAMGMLRRK